MTAWLYAPAVAEHSCPDCGAAAGVRCRVLTRNVTNPRRTKVDVQRRPCPARVQLAWQAHLSAEAA